jgi:hypothetical protein
MTNDCPWRLADLTFVRSGEGTERVTLNGVEIVRKRGDTGSGLTMVLSGATLTTGQWTPP